MTSHIGALNDIGISYCNEPHPTEKGVTCGAWGKHRTHLGYKPVRGQICPVRWVTTALAAYSDELRARDTDPISSHEHAARDFGIPQRLKGMRADIMGALFDRAVSSPDHPWMSCRQIAEAIYGPGPYTYDECVGINKVQTAALKLYREGVVSRAHERVIVYSVGGTN